MKRSELEQVVESIEPGMRFELTFKPEDPGVCLYLLAMVDKILRVEGTTPGLLYAIGTSGQWDHDQNRTVRICILPSFNKEWFVERLYGYLEAIKTL